MGGAFGQHRLPGNFAQTVPLLPHDLAAMSTIQDLQKQIDTLKADHGESLDTIWMLLAGLLVFFMHAGFSLLESGSVRFKNAQNILAKNLLTVTVGFLCWYAVGWPLAYGAVDSPNRFSGGTEFF